ncbi:MAG: Holliday junction resolvase RuvX [Clostridia bacterium]|nr:Holliday junction resolvase RuvX [Clostridia bacterium]
MRVLGIDYGDSRIGIALSDPFGWTAQGLETIHLKGNLDHAVDRVNQLIKEHGIEKVVIGFPRNMNGTIGERGEKTDAFIKLLTDTVNVQVIKWDERLTTVAANRTMHELGIKTSKKKGLVDQIAAVYILQGYLDSAK